MSQQSPLDKLFGSPAKVRVLQTFLSSPNAYFSPSDIAKRARISTSAAHRYIKEFAHVGVLQIKKDGKKKSKKTEKK